MKLRYNSCFIVGTIFLAMGILIFLNKYNIYAGFLNDSESIVSEMDSKTTQEEIAEEILRLHVIANSDTEEDQALKLKVKDEIVRYLKEVLKEAEQLETAREIVGSRLQDLEKIAKDVITEEGYSYSVTASLGEQEFPVKMYGDLVFPAGIYQAVQVKIGGHQGKNWWCVLFPSLCFIDGTYSIVPEESKEKLEEVIGEENYKTLLTVEEENSEVSDIREEHGTDSKIEIKWKIAEWFSK